MLGLFRKPSRPKLIAIAGQQGAGKDTVIAHFLLAMCMEPKWKLVSTSDFLINTYAAENGLDPEDVKEAKQRHRKGLQEVGDRLEKEEPAQVIKLALFPHLHQKQIILESIRRPSEIWYLTQKLKGFDVELVSVEASREVREKRRGKLVGETHGTEQDLSERMRKAGAWVIENNGTLEELKEEVIRFADYVRRK